MFSVHSVEMCESVRNGVDPGVSHMQIARGVREHGEAVHFVLGVGRHRGRGRLQHLGPPVGLGAPLHLRAQFLLQENKRSFIASCSFGTSKSSHPSSRLAEERPTRRREAPHQQTHPHRSPHRNSPKQGLLGFRQATGDRREKRGVALF
jgi:hypothetical protein